MTSSWLFGSFTSSGDFPFFSPLIEIVACAGTVSIERTVRSAVGAGAADAAAVVDAGGAGGGWGSGGGAEATSGPDAEAAGVARGSDFVRMKKKRTAAVAATPKNAAIAIARTGKRRRGAGCAREIDGSEC